MTFTEYVSFYGLSRSEGLVLRYGPFYGHGASDNLLDAVRKRQMPVIGGGTGIWSFCEITDAATATAEIVAKAPIVERPCEVETSCDAFIHNHHIVRQPPSELGRHPCH